MGRKNNKGEGGGGDGGGSCGDEGNSGVDISQILQVKKNDVPPVSTVHARSDTSGRRQDLGLAKNDTPPISTVRAHSDTRGRRRKKEIRNESVGAVRQKNTRKESHDESKVVVLARVNQKQQSEGVVLHKKNKKSTSGGLGLNNARTNDSDSSVPQLKQQLYEANRDLVKERNTREMLENRVQSMSNELTLIKGKLGQDKHYCATSLKEELDFEQRLRIDVQNDLSKANKLALVEQNKARLLEKEVESRKKANSAIRDQLQSVQEELNAEKSRHQTLLSDILAEKNRCQNLQKRLQQEAATGVAIRMELQSIKAKSGSERMKELEEQLRLERSVRCQQKVDASESAALRMELKSATEEIQRLKRALRVGKVETTEAQLQDAAEEMKQQSLALKKDRLVRVLRRELHETRQKLKSEQKRAAALMAQPSQKKSPKRSLSNWVEVAPTSSTQLTGGLIPIVQTPPRGGAQNMPSRPVEASLPSTSAETCTSPPASAPPSLFHFEEDDASIACDEALENLHDELTFLRNAYDDSEIVIEGNKVTHLLDLTTGYDSGVITIALSVTMPINYPNSGVLGVKASIQDANCSHEVRKCAIDALSSLEEVCVLEAKANEGREAIHPVFSVASGWANSDWYGILSKELSLSTGGKECFDGPSVEICVSLIYTHHLIEADRIQFVKKNASKLNLGGYIKIGKPGLILVEGTEGDCDQLVDILSHSKKIFHSTTFKSSGKVIHKEADDLCRQLPRKLEELENKQGMAELTTACQKLGLLQELNDIVSS